MSMNLGRRDALRFGVAGVAGLAFGRWILPASAEPTEPSGDLGRHGELLVQAEAPTPQPLGVWTPTEDNILGPFYRPQAPYRAKISPPLAPGNTLLISGRVWGHDTRRPLAGAVLDIWQASALGRYDEDRRNPPAPDGFLYRARLVTDETGYYEYETIHPGAYRIGPNRWRPSHIHYLVQADGYRRLVTQLYFKGDKYNETDEFIKPSLIIELSDADVRPRARASEDPQKLSYRRGVFDIVLAKA
jgi:protocatechuate 3,4-dioxygenase beta subunit